MRSSTLSVLAGLLDLGYQNEVFESYMTKKRIELPKLEKVDLELFQVRIDTRVLEKMRQFRKETNYTWRQIIEAAFLAVLKDHGKQ